MAWILLIIAGVLEVVWAYAMKLSNGFTQTTPTLVTAVAMVGSVVLLAIAMRTIPPRNSLCHMDRYRCDWNIPCGYHLAR